MTKSARILTQYVVKLERGNLERASNSDNSVIELSQKLDPDRPSPKDKGEISDGDETPTPASPGQVFIGGESNGRPH